MKPANETPRTVKALIEEADALVPRVTVERALQLLERGNVVLVDVRDAPEVEKSGRIAGALNISRGMLEFRADPASPYYDERLHPSRTVILYCASGGRSALGGRTLKDLGYTDVYNLGGFKSWQEAGGPVEGAPAA